MLELVNVSKSYTSKNGIKIEAVKDVNIVLPDTGMVSILGKSGCGKTTLLNCIGTLDMIDSGEIIFTTPGKEGKVISAFEESQLDSFRNVFLGFVFQDYFLIDSWTVYQNLDIVLSQQCQKAEEVLGCQRIKEILEFVGLSGYENRFVNELSGGQQQRVAIARALIKKPALIVADEPTGNLDSETASEILELLRRVSKDCLVVMVTHDTESAYSYSDRVLRISDGHIIADEILNETEGRSKDKKYEIQARNLPFRSLLNVAVAELKVKRWKFLLMLLIMSILFVTEEVIVGYLSSSESKAFASLIEKSGVSFIYPKTEFAIEESPGYSRIYEVANSSSLKKIYYDAFGANNCYPILNGVSVYDKNRKHGMEGFLVIGGIEDTKHELMGRMPRVETEIVISDYVESMLGFGEGESISEEILVMGCNMTVCGVVKLGYRDYLSEGENYSEQEMESFLYELEQSGERMIVCNSFIETINNSRYISIMGAIPHKNGEMLRDSDQRTVIGSATDEKVTLLSGRMPENDSEIIVSERFMLTYFQEETIFEDFGHVEFPDLHGEKYMNIFDGSICMHDYFPTYTIVGQYLDDNNTRADIIVTEQVFAKMQTDFQNDKYYDAIEISISEKNLNQKAIEKLMENGVSFETPRKNEVEMFYNKKAMTYETLQNEKMVVGVLIALLSILFFTFNAKDNHVRIGILRALGVSKRDLAISLIIEGTIIYCITIMVGFIGALGRYVYSLEMTKAGFGYAYELLNYNGMSILIPPIYLAVCFVMAIACPLFIMTGKKPIEVIKQF